jgi:hypothetical protein
MRTARATCTCLAVALAAARAAAADRGPGEIGVDFGMTSMDSNYDDTGQRALVRGGYHFHDRFELEGQGGGSIADCAVNNCAELQTWFVNGVFSFRGRTNVVPYVLAGAGIADREDFTIPFLVPQTTVPGDSSSAYQAGAGCRFFFGARKRSAVRVELSAFTEDTLGESSTHVNGMVGFLWRLGRAR